MYIVNKHGILMSIPESFALPEGARKATEAEIACFEETGEQEVAKMDLKPKKAPKKEELPPQ